MKKIFKKKIYLDVQANKCVNQVVVYQQKTKFKKKKKRKKPKKIYCRKSTNFFRSFFVLYMYLFFYLNFAFNKAHKINQKKKTRNIFGNLMSTKFQEKKKH